MRLIKISPWQLELDVIEWSCCLDRTICWLVFSSDECKAALTLSPEHYNIYCSENMFLGSQWWALLECSENRRESVRCNLCYYGHRGRRPLSSLLNCSLVQTLQIVTCITNCNVAWCKAEESLLLRGRHIGLRSPWPGLGLRTHLIRLFTNFQIFPEPRGTTIRVSNLVPYFSLNDRQENWRWGPVSFGCSLCQNIYCLFWVPQQDSNSNRLKSISWLPSLLGNWVFIQPVWRR